MFAPVLFNSVLGKRPAYSQKILSLSPILYYPMLESSGTTAENLGSVASGDGTYSGITLASAAGPMTSELAPLADGTNDHLDMYSANFNTAFDGNTGSLSFWFQMSAAGVWEDSTQRQFIKLFVDASNGISVGRTTTNNQIEFIHEGGGTVKTTDVTSLAGSTAWHHMAFTWGSGSATAYVDGSAETALTSLGTYAGSLSATRTTAFATSTVPAQVTSGYMQHIAIFDAKLAQADITLLAATI